METTDKTMSDDYQIMDDRWCCKVSSEWL